MNRLLFLVRLIAEFTPMPSLDDLRTALACVRHPLVTWAVLRISTPIYGPAVADRAAPILPALQMAVKTLRSIPGLAADIEAAWGWPSDEELSQIAQAVEGIRRDVWAEVDKIVADLKGSRCAASVAPDHVSEEEMPIEDAPPEVRDQLGKDRG